jgi:hypothetical protein
MPDKPSFDLEGTDLDAKPEEQPATPERKTEVHQGTDQRGNVILKSSTTLDEVHEEHVYVFYRQSNWEMVLEVDLLGDQVVFKSDGKIPPVIHILCPKCVRNGFKDNALSITHSSMGGTKGFEIEDIPVKDWGAVPHPQGGYVMGSDGKPVIVRRRLTIKEPFNCEYCKARYKITDNEMRDS